MKKNVLIVMSRFPYPPIGGDRLKNYNLLKILIKHFDVHLVVATDEIVKEIYVKEINNFVTTQKIFKKRKWQTYFNALKSLIIREPIQVGYYYFSDVKEYIDQEIKNKNIDFAISTLIRTSKYLEDIDILKYLDMVDSIGLNYQRSQANVKSIFWKLIYKIETKLLLDYEERYIHTFDNTFFVNKEETKYWSQFGKTTWIPNGVNKMLFNYDNKNDTYKNYIAFFGNMLYQPNIDAVLWFVENVFLHLDKRISLVIVGQKPKQSILNLAREYENIEVTGFIEDPYVYLNSTFAIVAPMQTGGGIQNKILECMALGKVNIVSSLGADPIDGAKNDEHFLVVDEATQWIKTINDIFNNPEKYKHLEKNVKPFTKENFTWENYENKLLNMLDHYK